MGRQNFLVDGVSGTGKTSVCAELARRGYHAIHGDRDLAYQGDLVTGEPRTGGGHEHHLWRVDQVLALAGDRAYNATFFCGGSRNFADFITVFDAVFILAIDRATLDRRLDQRPPGEWGAEPSERELVQRLHRTGRDTPPGTTIDATAPLGRVVDQILTLADRQTPLSP